MNKYWLVLKKDYYNVLHSGIPPSQARRKKAIRKVFWKMKKYILEAVVEGKYIKFHRSFKTRNSAIDYIFKYYNRHSLINLRVNEEYYIDEANKHDIAYVYDYYNRFRIARAWFSSKIIGHVWTEPHLVHRLKKSLLA